MTTIDRGFLSTITGGTGGFDSRAAFEALSMAAISGNNQHLHASTAEDGSGYEARLRADDGTGLVCTKSFGANPKYACSTFVGQ